MNIIELNLGQKITDDIKLSRIYIQLAELLKELNKKELPKKIILIINQEIEELNTTCLSGQYLNKLVKQKQKTILKLLKRELKMSPKNYYRNLWRAIGMIVFGLPIGVGFGLYMSDMRLLALSLPISMILGIAVGSSMDKKAKEEGRQLEAEIDPPKKLGSYIFMRKS